MTTDDVLVLHTEDMPWQTGREVISLMSPTFSENLGASHDHYDMYYQKNLWIDPETGRRTDLMKMDPGYQDASMGYHGCVEECFALEGQCDLWGEGQLEKGEYFWRPPGWVHAAGSTPGFTALLILESDRTDDGSGHVSRVISPDEDGGKNALFDELSDESLGPRGFVKRAYPQLQPWIDGVDFARGEGTLEGFDVEHLRVRILSKNWVSGAQTLLVELLPGYRQPTGGSLTSRIQFFVTDGSAQMGDTPLPTGSYVNAPAEAGTGALSTVDGATLFVKVDGWLDFRPSA